MPHVWIHFYLHSLNFTSFSFYPQPQFHSVFCLIFFHLIIEIELDFYDICSPRSQIRALQFCSFTIWLASILVWPRVNKINPKENHHLHFPCWCHFYFVSHCIHTSFSFGVLFHFDYCHKWGVLQDFHKPLQLTRRFPIFHSGNTSFSCHHFFSLEPSKLLKSKLISSCPWKRSRTTRLEFQLAIH